jgi:ribosomal-protein-alanine N-acetyltransferase
VTGIEATRRLRHGSIPDGLLPFEPLRDLAAVVELLRLGFGRDLDSQEQRWLSDLEAMADSGPLLLLLRLMPAVDGSFGGYVWYEDGRLVANASVMRAPSNVAVIANVVTHPDYRRRGIARRLTEAAIQEATERSARRVELQVRMSNEAAVSLYSGLGFRRLYGNTTYALASCDDSVRIGRAAEGFDVTAWRRQHDRLVRRLLLEAGRSLSEPIPGPVAEALGSGSIWDAFESWLRGRSRHCWAASDGSHFRAVVAVSPRTAGGTHRLEIVADPAWRGRVEAPLVDAVMIGLCREGPRPVEARVRDDESGASEALEAAGFSYVRTLERLALNLR